VPGHQGLQRTIPLEFAVIAENRKVVRSVHPHGMTGGSAHDTWRSFPIDPRIR
jgi:hypothetical protein